MPGTTLNRLIFWELVKVFLMSLGTVTGLLVTVPLFQLANQMGLSFSQVVAAVPLFVPRAEVRGVGLRDVEEHGAS